MTAPVRICAVQAASSFFDKAAALETALHRPGPTVIEVRETDDWLSG